MEARETVTELYTLRAGLSLIAQEKDKFDAEVSAAEEKKESAISSARKKADNITAINNEQLSVKKIASKTLMEELEKARSLASNAYDSYRDNERKTGDTLSIKSEIKHGKRKKALLIFSLILFIPLYLASVILVPIFSDSLIVVISAFVVSLGIGVAESVIACIKEYGFDLAVVPYILHVLCFGGLMAMRFCGVGAVDVWYSIILYCVTIIVTLVCIVMMSLRMGDYIDDETESLRRIGEKLSKTESANKRKASKSEFADETEREYQRLLKAYDENRSEFADLEEKCKMNIQKAEDKYNMVREEAEREYNEAYAASAETHGKISSVIYDSLVRTYGELLDVRDWGILDLVIWQMETGRAETLKEALQLADRETQTDRIVRTMQSASAAIAQRLDENFGSLKAQLSNSFYALATGIASAASSLSYQIGRSSDMLVERIGESAEATAALYESQKESMLATNRNLEQLFSQASLQTALLEKSNSSSKDLIDAVHKLRKAQQGER